MKHLSSSVVLMLLAFDGSCMVDAFVPVSAPLTNSHAVVEQAKIPSVQPLENTRFVRRQYNHDGRSSSTTLAMQGNLFDRFVRVFNANANKVVSRLEDPEKVIIQAVDDMQNDLVKIRQTYAESVARQRRLERQKEQSDAEGDGWYNRANLALRRGNESLAREALSRRQAFVDKSNALETQLTTQRNASDKLYDAMMSLESKIKDAASKKEQLIARARTAKSMQQVNDMLSGLGTGKNSMAAFTRMEEKVEALEAAAEASTDMTLIPDTTMESEFRLLEQSSEVEEELRKMKSSLNMLGPAAERDTFSVSSGTTEKERVRIPVVDRSRTF